jgi:acyl-CoA hydrolase
MRHLTRAEAAGVFSAGERVYLAGAGGEPTAFLDAWTQDGLPPGLTFVGGYLPGFNRRDPTAAAPDPRLETIFVTPELRQGFAAGRVRFLPLTYTQMWRYLATSKIDAAIFTVSPPDIAQECSLGIAADFSPAVLRQGVRLIAQINPVMPRTSAPRIPLTRFDAVLEAETSPPTMASGDFGAAFGRIAANVATLVRPGDTIQLGIGKLQGAVLAALAGHRDLGFHAGMISDAIMPLVESNVFSRGVVTGVAAGSTALYRWVAMRPDIAFRPVDQTHGLAALAAIPNLLAVNSVLEIDLFGQANAEMLEGRQVSGHGGLLDFLRGAAASPGGRSVLALPASTDDGRPRIHVALPAPVASTLRADADMVVTEHGVATLSGRDIDARADALIAIADPRHRDALADAWAQMRRRM